MFSVIDRYLLSEITKAMLAFVLVLIVIIMAHILIRYLEMVALGDISPSIMLQIIGIELLRALSRLLPPAFFFAVLFSLGRLYQNSEMIALEACGLHPLRIHRSLLLAAVPLAILVAWLAMDVLPWGTRMVDELEHREDQIAALAGLTPGRFHEYRQGKLVFYVESIDDKTKELRHLFVQTRDQERTSLVVAERGQQYLDQKTGSRYLLLHHGRRYDGIIGQNDYQLAQFERYALQITAGQGDNSELRRKAIPTSELLASDSIHFKAEFQARLALPLAVLAFAMLSIPLSRSQPRQGIYGRLAIAFLVYFIFLNLQGVSKNWMQDGVTPAALGTWWVPVLMLLTTMLLRVPDSQWGRALRRRWRQWWQR